MTSSGELAAALPEFAAHVRGTFEVRKHATLATLRRDGAPRISGTEVEFDDETGELCLGSMPGSRKLDDLRRDPRLALHCPTIDPLTEDPGAWLGDGKISGRAVEITDPVPAGQPARFRVDLDAVVLTRVGTPADHLVIASWRPGHGLVRRSRY